MLALVVLNNSIIKTPSFHLPFICHPSFMTFLNLKRSRFSCGTIFTSQVSFAMDLSLCLQNTSSFCLLVQRMVCPFPMITGPFMGIRLNKSTFYCLSFYWWLLICLFYFFPRIGKSHFLGDKSFLILS